MRRRQQELKELEASFGEGFVQTFSPLLDELKQHQQQAYMATALIAWCESEMLSVMPCRGATLRSSIPSC